jgi:hypothetical protein
VISNEIGYEYRTAYLNITSKLKEIKIDEWMDGWSEERFKNLMIALKSGIVPYVLLLPGRK